MLNEKEGTLKEPMEIVKILESRNLDYNVTSVCTSGSGISACVIDLAMRVLGNNKTGLYLGSWAQYVIFILFLTFNL